MLRSHRLPAALIQRVSGYLAYKEHSSGGVNMEVLEQVCGARLFLLPGPPFFLLGRA